MRIRTQNGFWGFLCAAYLLVLYLGLRALALFRSRSAEPYLYHKTFASRLGSDFLPILHDVRVRSNDCHCARLDRLVLKGFEAFKLARSYAAEQMRIVQSGSERRTC